MGKLTGKSWLPSNGTEGCSFIDEFCCNCIHEKFCHTQNHDDKQCTILNKSLLTTELIDEWVYDENDQPKCTAYVKFDWDKDDDGNWIDPVPPEPYNPNQLVLPFIVEEIEHNTIKQPQTV
jgi:hypothetical protein